MAQLAQRTEAFNQHSDVCPFVTRKAKSNWTVFHGDATYKYFPGYLLLSMDRDVWCATKLKPEGLEANL